MFRLSERPEHRPRPGPRHDRGPGVWAQIRREGMDPRAISRMRRNQPHDLDAFLEELESDIEISIKAIIAYYGEEDVNYEELDRSPPERTPHDVLITRGADLLEASAKLRHDFGEHRWTHRRNLEIEHILIGAGTEITFTGVHLKLKPDEVIDYMAERELTPPYSWSENALLEHLEEVLSTEEIEPIETGALILEHPLVDLCCLQRRLECEVGRDLGRAYVHLGVTEGQRQLLIR